MRTSLWALVSALLFLMPLPVLALEETPLPPRLIFELPLLEATTLDENPEQTRRPVQGLNLNLPAPYVLEHSQFLFSRDGIETGPPAKHHYSGPEKKDLLRHFGLFAYQYALGREDNFREKMPKSRFLLQHGRRHLQRWGLPDVDLNRPGIRYGAAVAGFGWKVFKQKLKFSTKDPLTGGKWDFRLRKFFAPEDAGVNVRYRVDLGGGHLDSFFSTYGTDEGREASVQLRWTLRW